MRLFVAVVPPEDVLEDLAERIAPLREADRDGALRWTDPHQWHLTLAFLEDVPEWRLDDLTEALGSTASRHPAGRLVLAGAGAFPDPSAARVLYAGVQEHAGDLAALARGVRTACNSVGATPDGARFHPHLTLGRFHRRTEATRWIRAFSAYRSAEWSAEELVLVASHLGEGRGRRPRYETLATLDLA